MHMNSINFNINQLEQRINSALAKAQRSTEQIKLLCVSKMASIDAIEKAIIAGQHCFAENYLQTALPKIQALRRYDLEWHFIGRIQRNKTRKIAEQFTWVQSIDNAKIAKCLNKHRQHQPPLNVCIQVNIDAAPDKAGVALDQIKPLATFIEQLPKLHLRGLMTIPTKHAKLGDDRKSYHRLKNIYQELQQSGFNLDTLSMGMSADLEAAIAEGATMIRIGRAIFNIDAITRKF